MTIDEPPKTFGASPKTFGAPPKTLGAPPKTLGAPPKTFGAPPKTLGAPPKTLGAPPKTLGAPPKTLGAPPKTLGAPPKTLGTPPKTYDAPSLAIGGSSMTMFMTRVSKYHRTPSLFSGHGNGLLLGKQPFKAGLWAGNFQGCQSNREGFDLIPRFGGGIHLCAASARRRRLRIQAGGLGVAFGGW